MSPFALPRRQRGVAVVTALLLTTLAVTIVASLFWQQQVQVRSIENQRLQLQKQWIMRGALDWAALILREDAKHSSIDDLDEPWAVPLAETRLDQYVENGRTDADASDAALSGGISDAQARYNLSNLCPGGIVDQEEVAVLARLFGNAQIDPALAEAVAALMAAAYAGPTTAADSPPAPQTIALTRPEDLLAVPGFTLPMLERIRDLVVVLPRATPVNVNTAPAEVLAARIATLDLAEAATLVESRKTASFRDIADFTSRLRVNSATLQSGDISVTTNYFLVDGKVRINRAALTAQALIEREGAITRLIRIREY